MNLRFLPGKDISLDTPLWRYMSLGAFFLLLQRNRVFVPTLQKLQEGDPKELWIRHHSVLPIADAFKDSRLFREAREWLKVKYRSRTGTDLDHFTSSSHLQDRSLIEEWIGQLGRRRCAWCWFSPEKPPASWMESMAMWNLYARNGVAIMTSLRCIKDALRERDLTEVLVAEMQYCVQGRPDRRFEEPDLAKRPFLFKSPSYAHEKEVRFVFQVNTAALSAGMKLNVAAKKLLAGGKVMISPFVFPDEANAVIRVARRFTRGVDVTLHASSEVAQRPRDPTGSLDLEDTIVRLYKPFARERDLPPLLREL